MSTLDLVVIAFTVWFAGAVLIALVLGRVFSLNQKQEQDERARARIRGPRPVRPPPLS